MDFERELQEFLSIFGPYAKRYFEDKRKAVSNYPKLIYQFYKDLADFTSGGKKLRGFLVYLSYKACIGDSSKKGIEKILPVVLAVELVHSFLLIHDDIIDQSEIRRGKPTVHKKFEETIQPSFKVADASELWRRSATDGKHYGVSQAIIIGDIACFEAIKLIAEARIDDKSKIRCIEKLLQTLLETGYGEALDVEYSRMGADFEKIWQVTNLKTARYSFVGPLTLGAILAGAKKSKIEDLSQFGLTLGTAFQIQDDILGVFGKEKTLGKSTLSDLREGKNTILIYKASEMAGDKDKEILDRIWGKRQARFGDLAKVKRIIGDSGALEWAKAQNQKLARRAKGYINEITDEQKLRLVFGQMVDFVVKRES